FTGIDSTRPANAEYTRTVRSSSQTSRPVRRRARGCAGWTTAVASTASCGLFEAKLTCWSFTLGAGVAASLAFSLQPAIHCKAANAAAIAHTGGNGMYRIMG